MAKNRIHVLPVTLLGALLGALAMPAAAQAIWLQASTANSPPARHGAMLAQDILRDRIVLFGGVSGFANYADTWEFDGTDWSRRTVTNVPPGGLGAMAYDRGRGRTVLVTGRDQATETWEYDGTTWIRATPATMPQGSGRDLLVYDAARGPLVLFILGFGQSGGETWEYNGIDWTHMNPPTSPPQLAEARMVYDPVRSRTILHGGYTGNGYTSGETWEYDGATWRLATNGGSNPVREDFAFAFDAHRRRAVLFGGAGPAPGTGTYEYAGTAWQLRTSIAPSDRVDAAMVYDAIRQECLMFGGATFGYGQDFADTYRYRALTPATAVAFGQGCAGSSIAPGFQPDYYHVPYVGMSMGFRLYSLPGNQPSFVMFGTSRTTTGVVGLPLSMQPFGMPNCQLLVSPDAIVPAIGSGHSALLTVQVPPRATLVGWQFYVQGFAFDLGGNAAGVINSRALACRIGSP